jgi:hypothetical protein
MHAERSESQLPEVESDIVELVGQYERVALMVLLEDAHPWTRSELEREIAGTRGGPGNVTSAIENLYCAGLAHISGELVIPSRAARKLDEMKAFCA